jgi:hypothetical protein
MNNLAVNGSCAIKPQRSASGGLRHPIIKTVFRINDFNPRQLELVVNLTEAKENNFVISLGKI